MHDVVDSFSISDGLTKVFPAHTVKVGIYWEWAEYLQALACAIGLGCLRMAQRCYVMAAKQDGVWRVVGLNVVER